MSNELKGIGGYSTALVICGAENMIDNVLKIIKALLNSHESGVYITVNQPFAVLEKIFKNKGVDTKNLFFIDCITKAAAGAPDRSDKCLYMSSPSSLTELGIGVMQALGSITGDKKFVFIDSLGTFLIYNSAGSLSQFSHFLITRISLLGVDGIIMSIDEEMDDKLKAELQSFCEKTITLK